MALFCTAARVAAVVAIALSSFACASTVNHQGEGELMGISIGAPIWPFEPGVSVEGGPVASASLGLGNVLTPSPSDFARFASVAPGETWLQANLGEVRPLRQIGLVGPFREADHVRFQASLTAIPGPEGVVPSDILSKSNLVGDLADITDDPDDAGDNTWLTAQTQRADGELLVQFPGRGSLLSGALSQEIRVSIRGASQEPSQTSGVLQLRQNGKIAASTTFTLDKPTRQVVSLVWDASQLGTPAGPFEVRVAAAVGSLGGGVGPAMEVGAVRWVAAASADGHDSGFIPAPVATADPLWQGSKARPKNNTVVYYEVGGDTVDAQFLRVDIRRTRERTPPEIGALVATVGYTPSVVPNVSQSGQHGGYEGIPAPLVAAGGQRHHGSVQEPPFGLRFDLKLLPRDEALELIRRIWGGGPAPVLISMVPDDPTQMDTIYGEVVAASGSPVSRSPKPDAPFNVTFQVVELR